MTKPLSSIVNPLISYKNESADEILLAVGPGTNITISHNDVKEIEPSPLSLMPPGMNSVLNQQELADLLAYLQSRKGN